MSCWKPAFDEGNEKINLYLLEFKPLSFKELVSQCSYDNAYAKGMAQLGTCPSKARIIWHISCCKFFVFMNVGRAYRALDMCISTEGPCSCQAVVLFTHSLNTVVPRVRYIRSWPAPCMTGSEVLHWQSLCHQWCNTTWLNLVLLIPDKVMVFDVHCTPLVVMPTFATVMGQMIWSATFNLWLKAVHGTPSAAQEHYATSAKACSCWCCHNMHLKYHADASCLQHFSTICTDCLRYLHPSHHVTAAYPCPTYAWSLLLHLAP